MKEQGQQNKDSTARKERIFAFVFVFVLATKAKRMNSKRCNETKKWRWETKSAADDVDNDDDNDDNDGNNPHNRLTTQQWNE